MKRHRLTAQRDNFQHGIQVYFRTQPFAAYIDGLPPTCRSARSTLNEKVKERFEVANLNARFGGA